MKLTARGKFFVIKVFMCLLMAMIFFISMFLPVFRIDWINEDYGIKEEYYMEISTYQYLQGSEVQVHLNNSKALEEWEKIGVTKEELEKLLGTVEITELKEKSKFKASTFSDNLIYGVISGFCFTGLILISKKKDEKYSLKIDETYKKKGLDPEKERKIVALLDSNYNWYVFCLSSFFWGFALLSLFDVYYELSNYYDEINLTFGSYSIWGIICIVFLFIVPAIVEASARVELRKYNIIDADTLRSMPYIGNTSSYIKLSTEE